MLNKLVSLGILCALVALPSFTSTTHASSIELVETSTHFIDVPAGSAGSGSLTLAATLYQPRFLLSAPAAVYIHGWGGHRLTGSDNLAYYIAAAGYIVLSYTARGFGSGESGGQVTLAGPDEINDLGRVIDWLMDDPDRVVRPRVTKIGVIGGSYGGGHSFQISSDPRVSAVIPLVGWTDLEESLFPNGVINYQLGLAEFYGGLDRQVGQPPFYNYSRLQFDLFDSAAAGRVPDSSVFDALRVRSIAHKNGSGLETLEPTRQPRAPVFIIQSWDDYLFPATQVLDVFTQITAPKQIYLGRSGHPPGGHTFEGEELYIATQVLRWFDHYLRGIGGTDGRSIASAPVPFSGQLLLARQFPPDDVSPLSLFLKPGGNLARKRKGPDTPESAGGIFRPERMRSSRSGAEIPAREDMFSGRVDSTSSWPRQRVYTFGPFESDTEMIGSSEFNLFISSATSSAMDVIVRTYDVAPDGTESEVTVGVARINGLSAGEVRRISFRDYGDNWIFTSGHSLRLKISNIDFPAFRPPGQNDNVGSEITLHYGKGFPSGITIPVRTR